MSFHIEHFSTSFKRLDQTQLAGVLGEETVSALRQLWERVPAELPQLSGLEEEELSRTMRASIVREEVEIPLPSATQLGIWREALHTWEYGSDAAEPMHATAVRLRIRRELLKKSQKWAESMRGHAAGATEAILSGLRLPEESAPALAAARVRPGNRHDRFVWDETGDDPVRVELREEGDMLWATGFATAAFRGQAVAVRIWFKPQVLKGVTLEGDFDPETGELAAAGAIAADGWFHLLLGRRTSPNRLPRELVEGLEVGIG